MVQAARLLRQAVRRAQSRPAVAAAEELVRQAKAQRGVPAQVREAGDPEPFGVRPAHAERVAVAEAQRHGRREAQRGEPAVDPPQVEPVLRLHDLARDGAGVLGIDVDRPGAQRLEQHRGVAQPRAMRAARHLRDDLPEDIGLGEALRADHEGLRRRRAAAGRQGERQRGAARRHARSRATPARGTGARRGSRRGRSSASARHGVPAPRSRRAP